MTQSTYDTYLENEVLHADPLQLVCILYRAALDATASARLHLRNGEILVRSRCVSKATGIIHELLQSLDAGAPEEIRGNLAALYVYMLERMTQANAEQTDAPLAEVERLLGTLLEAWSKAASGVARNLSNSGPDSGPDSLPDSEYARLSCSY